MYMHVCVCMCVGARVYRCMNVQVHACVSAHVCMHVCVGVSVYVRANVCMFTSVSACED